MPIYLFPGDRNGNPLQCSCLGSPMDRGAWRTTVLGVTKSQDMTLWLNNNNVFVIFHVGRLQSHRTSFTPYYPIYELFGPWFPHQERKDNNNTYFIGLLWGWNEFFFLGKVLRTWQLHSKLSQKTTPVLSTTKHSTSVFLVGRTDCWKPTHRKVLFNWIWTLFLWLPLCLEQQCN